MRPTIKTYITLNSTLRVVTSTEVIVDSLISGLAMGGIYALAASGLALVYGAANVLNLAHGSLVALGAYAGWYVLVLTGNVMFALVAGFLATFLVGALLERLAFKPFRGRALELLNVFFVSMAISIILELSLLIGFGARRKSFPPLLSGYFEIGGFTIAGQKLMIIAVAVVSLLLLWIFLTRTKTGIAVRAVAQDKEAVQLAGVDIDRIYLVTLSIGSGMAGVSGVLLGSIYLLHPMMGREVLTLALVVIVLSGLGRVQGAIASSFILAEVQSLTAGLLSLSWSLPITLMAALVLFILRPQGVFKGRL